MPKMFTYQSKQIAYNVYSYYKKRKMDKTSYEYRENVNIIEIIADATLMPQTSISRIIKEGNAMKIRDGVVDFRPKEKKKYTRKKRVLFDDFTEGLIRRKLIQLGSVRKLTTLLKEENILQCSLEFLRVFVHKLGFTSDSSGVMREDTEIRLDRMRYLEAIKDYRAQDLPIFYLHDTKRWLHEKYFAGSAKQKEMPSLVIVHTSGATGFSNGAQLMLKMKPTSEDDECFEHFENYDWLNNEVLRNIPANSVIVMNIPYCETAESMLADERPTAESPIESIKEWFKKHNILVPETATDSDLLELLTSVEAKIEYSFTKIIKECGHEALHLPLNHSDLNPVTVMWHDVREDASETPAKDLFFNYPSAKWRSCLDHVREVEEEYYTYGTNTMKPAQDSKRKKKKSIKKSAKSTENDNENNMDCN